MTAAAPGNLATPLLRLDGMTKQFGSYIAVHPVQLDIAAGEFVTLLGPSGCGKTTLLRLISGLEQPSGGRIWVNGRDLTHLPPERRPFNMVFQSYALFPHLNVFDNVAYGLRAAGQPERRVAERVREALAIVGLQTHGSRPIDQLSGGMSQRVALARATVGEPQVLLLDEPLAALDLQLRKRMQVELRAIQERTGTTFVLVTHDQEEALAMSDRIVLMQAGRIVQTGTPQEIYNFPRTRFVAEFVGESELLGCDVRRECGNTVEVELPGGRTARFSHYGEPGLAPGTAGLVVLRPQHLREAAPDHALFAGAVESVMFTGMATTRVVALEGGGRLRISTSKETGPRRGERVGIDLLPGAGVFVRAEESAISYVT